MVRSARKVAVVCAMVVLGGCKEATGVHQGCRLAPFILAGLPATLPVGAQTELTITYPCGKPNPLFADWQVADTTIATIKGTSDTSAVLFGKRVGQTSFTLDVPGYRASGQLTVVPAQ